MQEIGQELKQAREEKGLAMEELTAKTMIAKKYLRALEDGDFDVFPGEVYLKGALRKYAGELGLDADVLMARYNSAYGENAETSPKQKSKPDAAPKKVAVLPSQKVTRRYTGRVNTGRLTLVVLVIALFVVGLYAVITALNNTDVPVVDLPPPNGVPNGEIPGGEDPVDVEPEPEPPQVRVERDSREDKVLFHVYNAEGTIEAELAFTGLCWVGITADGSYQEKTYSAGQSVTVAFENEASIRPGNPPAMEMTVNGVPVDLPDRERPYTFELVNAGFDE
jgi:cytoskeletal protein RodZ